MNNSYLLTWFIGAEFLGDRAEALEAYNANQRSGTGPELFERRGNDWVRIRPVDPAVDDAATEGRMLPFEARSVMQQAIWHECIEPRNNEWTTGSDAIVLAEVAAAALVRYGYHVVQEGQGVVDGSAVVLEFARWLDPDGNTSATDGPPVDGSEPLYRVRPNAEEQDGG